MFFTQTSVKTVTDIKEQGLEFRFDWLSKEEVEQLRAQLAALSPEVAKKMVVRDYETVFGATLYIPLIKDNDTVKSQGN
ncbi:hypothetical protein ACFLZY_03010 [Patescibacteria group bacterium]